MTELCRVEVALTFLSATEGGRPEPPDFFAGGWYRPHLVVDGGVPLGVVVDGVRPGDDPQRCMATVRLAYDGVDYSALVPGALFSVQEGARVVARGTVLPG